MRPVRIIATTVLVAALAGTGCNRAQPGYRLVRHRPEDGTGGCSGHPDLPRVCCLRTGRRHLRGDGLDVGQGQHRRRGGGLVCGAERLCWLPLPGRKDTFQATGRQSGRAPSATFTVTG
jgi:hypothetical protein